MTIEKMLKQYGELFDTKLDALFPVSNEEYAKVAEAARYSLLLGGKRIRPILLMEFYRLCGGKGDYAINFAAAMEMIHTYSLIHDDLPCMDNDDLRRGKPACHKAYGEATALLAGDALLTHAFFVASRTQNIPAERVVKAIQVLGGYSGVDGMIGGQVLDLKNEKLKNVSVENILQTYDLKTAALLKAAAAIGCILAGGGNEEVVAASRYAHLLGTAFQITDDILDFEGNEATLGKPVHSDEKNSKNTYVTKLGLSAAKQQASDLTCEAVAALGAFGGDITTITALTEYLLLRKF